MDVQQQTKKSSPPLRIMSVTGGKGGIGKTTIAVNMAVCYAKMKKKVLLFDADLGLANVDLMLGLRPQKTIHDVINGDCTLEEACVEGPYGLKIIPSASGIQKMADLGAGEISRLIQSFSSITSEFDIMIIDMASGVSTQVIDFTQATQDILVVICNNPSSLMDSYAVIKILHQKYARSRFGIVVNKVKSSYEGFEVYSKFQEVVAKFINISMHYLGHIPQDECIHLSALQHVSIVDKFPQSSAVKALEKLCHGVTQWPDDSPLTGGIQFFFERLIRSQLDHA
jgi:flagellar biosynthesis protein FlhG